MTPSEQGRRCGQCNTIVTDMTRLSNDEIMDLLKTESVKCARFYEDQLTLPETAKGWLMQWLGRTKKDWVFASMLLMLQLNTPSEIEAGVPRVEQLIQDSTLTPIDSGVALPGYVQGQLLRSDTIPVAKKSVYLYTSTGKRIATIDTDDKGFFAFTIPDDLTEESYRLVFKHTKYKKGRFVYHWHKAKIECQKGTWTEFKVERSRKKRILRKRVRMGCPKFR